MLLPMLFWFMHKIFMNGFYANTRSNSMQTKSGEYINGWEIVAGVACVTSILAISVVVVLGSITYGLVVVL